MEIAVFANYEAQSLFAADFYANYINGNKNCVLGLATGSTPELLYADLARKCSDGKVSFKDVTSFNLDEYCGIPADNGKSYRTFMKKNLFDKVDIAPDAWNLPDGNPADAGLACLEYERAIIDAGGIDLQLLGLGNNGHIGFNEPADHFPVETHIVDLNERTIQANSRFFDSEDDVPKKAITMGIGTIMKAKKIVIMAAGEQKADIVEKAFLGDVIPQVPASVLQLHREVLVLLDEAAASLLMKNVDRQDPNYTITDFT